jgi:tRNA G18 (ribose-2'-O)-methylase SpoU
MGTVCQVPWTRLPEWGAARRLLTEHGFVVAALALAADAVPLRELAAEPPERLALVLGAEGDGLSRPALAASDTARGRSATLTALRSTRTPLELHRSSA